MTEIAAMDLLSQGLSIFLVVGGALFAALKVWPWFTDRDTEERQRRFELSLQHQAVEDRTADNLTRIARRLDTGLLVSISRDSPE